MSTKSSCCGKTFVREENPTIVIRRLHNTTEKEAEEWSQAQKFHMRVRVEDKSANLIIDNGSVINFIV